MEVGAENEKLKVGDRVVVPFTISCGECEQCRRGNFSVCERTNRNPNLGDLTFGHRTAGMFGYTHLTGGYAGGQAEYVRAPYADVGPVKIPSGLSDEVICIDNVPERLEMARAGGAITIDFDEESVLERLQELTAGKGPEKCIDAIGMEAYPYRSIDYSGRLGFPRPAAEMRGVGARPSTSMKAQAGPPPSNAFGGASPSRARIPGAVFP